MTKLLSLYKITFYKAKLFKVNVSKIARICDYAFPVVLFQSNAACFQSIEQNCDSLSGYICILGTGPLRHCRTPLPPLTLPR